MQSPSTIPVMPMRHAVVYPGIPTPLGVRRVISQRAIEAAQRQRGFLFAVTQRSPVDEPSVEDLHRVGSVVKLLDVKPSGGEWEVLLQGVTRARATLYLKDGPHLSAAIEPLFDRLPEDREEPAFVAVERELRERLTTLGQLRGVPPAVLAEVLATLSEPGVLADFVASYLELSTSSKQALLETPNVAARMNEVLRQLHRQIEVERTRDEIRGKVSKELGTRQREVFLREQLKVIREELGEDDATDLDELVIRIESLELPERVRSEVTREARRLGRTNPESAEAQVLRTYLEWVLALPWNTATEDQLDLAHAAAVLDEDHHGLVRVKERILEFLAVRSLHARQTNGDRSGPIRCPILLFVGPPGVGKTSVAASIARALGRAYVRVALGGVHDESDIRGHRRTYVGAMPGRIVDGLRAAGTRNPVFVLDEIDKLGQSWHGHPAHALLEVLDPSQNDSFTDHFLNVPFDLREVLFIATANTIESIPHALLDRMEVVVFDGYSERDKVAIGRRFLIPRGMREAGLSEGPAWRDDALRSLVRERTRESGVRQLEREIGAVLRKLARLLESGHSMPHDLGASEVRHLLGRSRFRSESALAHDEVGTATGMVYTPNGGDIMFVEAAIRPLGVPGLGAPTDVRMILTGQLGDVMKESARAALTVALTEAGRLGGADARGGPLEVHLHVPAGAVPKDGPSAGVTMVTALVSRLCRTPVRRDIALTGEITLSGRVLAVGGLEEKLLGAERAGIRHVVIPQDNLDDLGGIPSEVRERLSIHTVNDIRQVLALALRVEERVRGEEANGSATTMDASRPMTDLA
jgi:ATP-dependent Lon protease